MIYQSENFGKSYDYRSGRHTEFIISEHLHDYSEILFCISGEADIKIGDRFLTLKGGELVFIPSNVTHKYMCRNCDVFCAVFSNDYIPLFFNTLGGKVVRSEPVDVSDMKSVTDRLLTLDGTNQLAVCGCLNLLCERVTEKSSFESTGASDPSLYQKAITYISEHYTEDITLKTVAAEFGYNEKYLSASLHSLTGMNFRRLISNYRIDYAMRLLESEDISIAEIAHKSGFSAINSFNRVFLSHTGVAPGEYRKKNKRY